MSQQSEQQGFFKPIVSVQVPRVIEPGLGGGDGEEGKDLTLVSRPTDFKARMLHSAGSFHTSLHCRLSHCTEQLLPLRFQPLKQCKYISLQQKYHNNELYNLVYSRRNNNFFNLEGLTDYNPKHYITAESKECPTQVFDSRFQGGNLLQAYKHTRAQGVSYDLLMQDDTNTHGYNQWFYFSYTAHSAIKVRFNIVNFIKKHLLFEEGVRPIGLRCGSAPQWQSIGQDISYQKSYVKKDNGNNYYTLSFTYNFQCAGTMYIALNYPYTYTMLRQYLQGLTPHPSITIQQSILCYTPSNNPVFALTIHCTAKRPKKKILIMARQHPGESVGSFVLQGFINRAIKDIKLLSSYEMVIIPMVNPDGVIYGNFRTNLAGFDLNRQWAQPNKHLHPQIYAISNYIDSMRSLHFVIDFHGHSKKWNTFTYACNGDNAVEFKLYPLLYSKLCSMFSLKDSTFNITADKQRTARVTIHQEMNLLFVYTVETSFFGYSRGQARYRYEIEDLIGVGNKALESMRGILMDRVQGLEKEVKEMQHMFNLWAMQNREDYGSESNPSEDQLTWQERKEKVMRQKNNSIKRIKRKKNNKVVANTISNVVEMRSKEIEVKREINKIQYERPKINHTSVQEIRKSKAVTSRREVERGKIYLLKEPTLKGLNKIKIDLGQRKKKTVHVEMRVEKKSVSNLFNNSNFYSQMQSRLEESKKQTEERKKQEGSHFAEKTYSLEISSISSHPQMSTIDKNNTTTIIRRLMPLDSKQREKLCIVQEKDRTEEEIKKSIEREIHHRTAALRNCQQKMREITMECEGMIGVRNKPYKLFS